MIISFFNDTVYSVGIDYSNHPDLVIQENVENFDPYKNIAILENGKIKIIPKPEEEKVETEAEKFERIFKKICSPEIILNSETDHEILEWVEFSDTAIGDVIATKVFFDEKTGKWNPHGQMAMMAKTIADPSYKETEEVQNKMKSINDIRVFFGLVAFRSIK